MTTTRDIPTEARRQRRTEYKSAREDLFQVLNKTTDEDDRARLLRVLNILTVWANR